MIDKAAYSKWLAFQIDMYERYHNHKETMAWVITALYVPGIIYWGWGICRGCGEWAVLGLMAFVLYFVLLFVNMQFRKRWEAADAVKVLRQCWTELNRGGEPPRDGDWCIDSKEKDNKEKNDWPRFMQGEVDELHEQRKLRKSWKFRAKSLSLCHNGWLYDRWKTEIPSYIVIILATVFAMCIAWG